MKTSFMVRKVEKKGQILYQCEECGFYYRDKEIAEKCEMWCREHQSCNLEIIKNAIENEQQ